MCALCALVVFVWLVLASPLAGAKRSYVTGGAGPSQTKQIDEFLSVGRGQPVGPLATSTGGRGIAADLLATRPLQVLLPCVLRTP